MVEIYVDQISERLIYTLDFVFNERGLSYKLTNDHHTFAVSDHLKLNYSEKQFDESVLTLAPSSLLFDEFVFTYAVDKAVFEKEFCLAFNRVVDPLASIFYVLSRMEEYQDSRTDVHGRYLSKNSILSQYGWLQKAMCDRWAMDFLLFLSRNIGFDYGDQQCYVPIRPTFDIDNTYAYRWKEGGRKYLSIARDYLKGDKKRLKERSDVLQGKKKDPYDTFEYIQQIVERGFKINLFWLLGDYAQYDKNISYRDLRQQNLIKELASIAEIGIHPSYKSSSHPSMISDEVKRLESMINNQVINSRQHFLRVFIPKTYTSLLSAGIQHDFSMGYADSVGFRAGTARPFRWFDLVKNCTTDLWIHPFVYMDGTLNEYLLISPEESKILINNLYREVCEFGGEFVFIWHNETIGDYGKWENWSEVLEYTLNLQKDKM